MTCIVGIVNNGKIWMGSDSCISDSVLSETVPIDKVMIKKNVMIGVAGNFRLFDLIDQHYYGIKKSIKSNYIRGDFIENIISILEVNKMLGKNENDIMELSENNLLIGFDKKLYYIEKSLAVFNCPSWGYAIGSGSDVAKGSLLSTQDKKPKDRIMSALYASTMVCSDVKEPFKIYTL
jgi:ATP-dependent protease HslVU (ClpYQ) peptidase subunit